LNDERTTKYLRVLQVLLLKETGGGSAPVLCGAPSGRGELRAENGHDLPFVTDRFLTQLYALNPQSQFAA